MKFVKTYSSDHMDKKRRIININTLSELLSLIDKENSSIIIHSNTSDYETGHIEYGIEIYDEYRE